MGSSSFVLKLDPYKIGFFNVPPRSSEDDQSPHSESGPQHAGPHPRGDLLSAPEAQPSGRHVQQAAEAAA